MSTVDLSMLARSLARQVDVAPAGPRDTGSPAGRPPVTTAPAVGARPAH